MTSIGSLELKNTIDNGLPWKMAAKGSRSSTRRTRKHVSLPAAPEAAAKDSESGQQLGVSVLGQTERVEHVPLKKRRFTPSPLNRSAACRESSQNSAGINHALPVSRLNPSLTGGKIAENSDDKPDCGYHDFSGIKILAEVACSSGMSTDIASVVDDQPVEPVQQQDALTVSTHVEGNDSSTGTIDVSGNDTAMGSSDKVGDGKSEIVVPQKVLDYTLCRSLDADQSEDHSMVVVQNISVAVSNESSTERPKENTEAGDSENLSTHRETVTVSDSLAGDERTEKGKKSECLTDDRLHWDLNLPTDAWGQPCDAIDDVSRKYSVGEVTDSITASRRVDVCKDYAAGLIASDVHTNSPSLSAGPKAEASTQNGKECQSGYDSQFEDGELREPYPWEENEGDSGDVEQVDYGSEPENERFYSLDESNENKLEDVEKGVLAETKFGPCNVHEGSIEKHIVVCMNDSKGSSPSRSFGSKPFRAPHETFPRRRPDRYEELSKRDGGPNKFIRRDRTGMRMRSRSPGKGQFGGWDSERRFSPPVYKGGQYDFGRPRLKTFVEGGVTINGFDEPGPGAGPHRYARKQFSNGGYQGRFRRFSDGYWNSDFRGGGYGSRDFRGVDRSSPPGSANGYPSRMHNNRMNGRRDRSNSPPIFRRLHEPQSRSRSRSRSPMSWNGQNRSGFRADDNRMERVRLQFPKRFPLNEEMRFMSPERNQRDTSFFDNRFNDGGGEKYHDNLRRRKLPPGRMFRQEHKFDNMRRMNSENNNNFRPFVRHNNNSRRFSDGGGSRVGRCKYEGAEEKNVNKYEMVHCPQPLRLEAMEEDGDNIRRFRLDAEQHTVVSIDNNNNEKAS